MFPLEISEESGFRRAVPKMMFSKISTEVNVVLERGKGLREASLRRRRTVEIAEELMNKK